MPRYPDDDYPPRERNPTRREQPRERDRERDRDRGERGDRHTNSRMIDERLGDPRDTRMLDDPMDIQPQRLDSIRDPRIDQRMDPRIDPRANAGARLEPRNERGMEPRRGESDVLYRDARTGQLLDARTGQLLDARTGQYYRDEPPARAAFAREDRMERDDVPQSRTRDIIDFPPAREREEENKPTYNEYFVPGEGIDREVIQHEICKYLGQDATCRPYRHKDGRTGYLVRAYRAFTSQMIRSLKDESAKWVRDREKRQKSGRSGGSYAEMRDRQDSQQRTYDDGMDLDDYDRPPPRHRGDLDPRPSTGGRHTLTPVSSGYAPEPGYSLASNQPGNYNPASEPRYNNPGNSTPPGVSRGGQPVYTQASYPARTVGVQAPLPPVASYRDPRTGEMITSYAPAPGTGYPTETVRPRHR